MKTSEQINDIAAALAKAQTKVKNAIPNAENPHFRSSYADLEAVKAACMDALNANGIAVVQSPVVTDGRVGVTTRLLHSSGQWIEGEFTMPSVKADPQGYGSALTYARRYTLAAFAGVATGEDDDGEGAHGRGEKDKGGNGNKTAPAAKPTSTPPPPSPAKPTGKMPEAVTKLGDGEMVRLVRTVDRVEPPPQGKKAKRVHFVGDATSYWTLHKLDGVAHGDQIECEITAHAQGDSFNYEVGEWSKVQKEQLPFLEQDADQMKVPF